MKDRTDHSTPTPAPRADAILREGLRLLALGRQDEAVVNIGRAAQLCAGADDPDETLSHMLQAARHWRPPAAPLRSRTLIAAGADVAVSPPGPADCCAVVFLSKPRGIMAPYEIVDAELARRGIAALYLYDTTQRGFGRGVASVGGGLAGMHGFIRDHLNATRPRHVFTIGASVTGCAAAATALHLRLQACLLLSPVVAISAGFRGQWGDRRRAHSARQAEEELGAYVDLHSWYRDTVHRPLMRVHYGAWNRIDRLQARTMRGFENTELRPIDELAAHNCLWHGLAKGWFADAIGRMAGSETAPEGAALS